ncbi:MAG: hypothetical protein U0Y68_13090 [Blastocatellia bacterium]
MKEIRRLTITKTRRLRLTVVRALCPVCGYEVTTLNSDEAIAVLGVDGRQFDKWVAAGNIHTIRLARGEKRICRESLFDKCG